MTPAEKAGIVAGKHYTVVGVSKEGTYFNVTSGVTKGCTVVLAQDNNHVCTQFYVVRAGVVDKSDYELINVVDTELREVGSTAVVFEEKEVTTTVTVINAGRQLTQAEKDAIAKIIEGAK